MFFLKNGCPLCGKYHPVKFYIFVERHIIIALDNDLKIFVVRIFCEVNFKQRKESRKPLQYTITVLPGFLIPYSRVPAGKVFKTVAGYMLGIIRNQYAAAIELGCNSRHTFRLYYVRILKKLDIWLQATHPAVQELETDISRSVVEKWEIISRGMKDWPPPHQSDKWREYGHTIFCFKKMGLGP